MKNSLRLTLLDGALTLIFGITFVRNATAQIPAPVVTGRTIVCMGNTTTLTASIDPPQENITYRWYEIVEGLPVLQYIGNPYTSPPLFFSTQYAVEAFNGTETSPQTLVNITVNPGTNLDLPTATPADFVVCNGDSTTYTATSLLGLTIFNWYDSPAGGNLIFTGNPYHTGPLTLASNLYVTSLDEGGCESSRNLALPVTVVPLPDAPLVTPATAIICSGDSASFTASSISGGTSFYWYDTISGGSPIDSGAVFNTGPIDNTGALNATRTYYVELVDENMCRSLRTSAVLVIRPALDAPAVKPGSSTICSGDSITLTASSLSTGATFTWHDSLTGGNELFAGNPFNTGPIINNGPADIVRYFYAEAHDTNGCSSIRGFAQVTIRPAIDAPTVEPPVAEACSGDSVTFTASSLLGSTEFSWYDQATGGNQLATGPTFNTGPITNTGTANLTRTYYAETTDSNGCRSVRTPATVIVTPLPDAPVVNPPVDTICSGGSATFTASALLGGSTFNWYDESTGGNLLFTGDTFNTGPITNTGTTGLTRNFYVEVTDSNGCASPRTPATVVILKNLDLPASDPLVDTICSGQQATFVGTSVLTSPVFNWYDNATGGELLFTGDTFTTPAQENTTTSDITIVYWLEAEDAYGCRSARTPATAVVQPAVEVPVTNPVADTVCSGQTATFTASSLLGTAATYRWYDAITGGNLLFTGNPFVTPQQTNNGATVLTRQYYVEAVSQSGCASTRTAATVVILPMVDLVTVEPSVSPICSGDSVTFTASTALGSEDHFEWYDAFSGGNRLFTGNPYNTGPIVNSGSTDMTRVFYAEAVTAEGCRSARAPAVAVIRPAVGVPIADPPADTICSGATAEFTASSLLGDRATFHWYDVPTGGEPVHTGEVFNTGPISNTSAADAVRQYYLELEDVDGCRSVRTPVTVVIKPALDLPLVDPVIDTICSGGSGEFTASSILDSNVTFYWFDQPSGGNLLFVGNPFNTGTVYNNDPVDQVREYWVESRDSEGCTSLRNVATLVILPALDVPMVDPAIDTICSGQAAEFTAMSLLSGEATFNWYDSLQGTAPIFTGETFNTGPLTSQSAADLTREYYVEAVAENGCRSLRTPATVVITPALDYPYVDPPLSVVCSGQSATLTANSLLLDSTSTFNWYETSSGGEPVFTGNPFTTPPVTNEGSTDVTTVYYAELENGSGCRSLRSPAVVLTLPAVDVPVVNPPSTVICNGESATFTATSLLGNSEFRWYDAITNGNLLFVGDTFNTGPITTTGGADVTRTYYVEVIDSNGCSSARMPASVTIRPAINVPIVNPPIDTICTGTSAQFIATSVLGESTFRWYDNISGGNLLFVGDTFTTEPLFNETSTDAVRFFYVSATDSSGCESNRIPVVAVITPAQGVVLVDPAAQSICSGDSAMITASNPLDSASTFYWYTSPAGGEPIFTGNPFNSGPLTNEGTEDATRTYYVEAANAGGCRTLRSAATVVIRPALDQPIVRPVVDVVCNGESAEFIATSVLDSNATFYWYEVSSGGTPVFVGDTFVTPPLFNSGDDAIAKTYYVELEDSAGCRSPRTTVGAVVRPAVDAPSANPPIDTICSGQQAMFVGTSLIPGPKTFNWYTEMIGGTPVFTGDTFVTEPIENSGATDAMRMYFLEVTDSLGCRSNRTPATVVILPATDYPVVDPPAQTICSGDSATIVASSLLDSTATFYWYDSPTGGEPVFVGDTFNTGPLFTSEQTTTKRYYVESRSTGGCKSLRAVATVNVYVNPDVVLLAAEDLSICQGESTTIVATSVLQNDTIRWYLQEQGGAPIFVGDTFNTGPLDTTTTFYAASADDSSGCESARFPITITVGSTEQLPAPVVECDEQPSDSLVAFTWNEIKDADAYEVSTDNGQTWKNPSSGPQGTRHVEARQSAGQVGVSLVVRAVNLTNECGPREGATSIGKFCTFSDEIDPEDVDIYNSFSPNGDGANDYWYVTEGIENYANNEVMVFNRWGQLVFEMKGYDNNKRVFTGEGLEDGAYFYVVRIPDINVEKTGYVMIIR